MSLREKMLGKVTVIPDTGCWQWTGKSTPGGYGVVYLGHGRYRAAHRQMYEEMVAPVPDRLDVCHKCDNPPCVNPQHLFLGTVSDNMKDMYAKGRRYPGGKKGKCLRGHPRTPENLRGRQCKECVRINQRAYRERLRSA